MSVSSAAPSSRLPSTSAAAVSEGLSSRLERLKREEKDREDRQTMVARSGSKKELTISHMVLIESLEMEPIVLATASETLLLLFPSELFD